MRSRSLNAQLAIVAAASVVCYVTILPNEFCYDDVPVVRDNPKVLGALPWSSIWTTDYWSHTGQDHATRDLLYRPTTLSLFRLTHSIAGPAPAAFHAISILLHALCSMLVVILAKKLFEGLRACEEGAIGGLEFIPLISGLLFAVLPIHSEAVAAVVGQSDLIATAATIGALLSHLRAVHSRRVAQKLPWLCFAAMCAFLAMGAKESGICVVAVIILFELIGLANRDRPETRLIARIARASYLLLPLAAYLLLRHQALGGQLHQAPAPTRTVNLLVDAPAWQHALGVMQAWGMYLSKSIFPRVLAIEYSINSVRLAGGLWQFHVLLGILWTITLLLVSITSWRNRQKELAFLAVALILSYLPTSNAIVLIQVFFAERIWYLPSVFFVCLFAFGLRRIWIQRLWQRIGLVVLAGMMVRCIVRSNDWRNNGTLFAAAYYDHPSSVIARHLYGQWLTQNGRLDEGISLIRKALEIDLGFTDAHRSLGLAYLEADQPEPALRHLQIAEMQAPDHPPTQAALAKATTMLEASRRERLATLRSDAEKSPADIEANLAYVRELRELGQTDEALRLLQRADSPFSGSSDWIAEIAITLVFMDRRDDAIDTYRKSLVLEPEHAQRCIELAMLLLERRAAGDLDESSSLVDRARRLAPQSPQVLVALGELEMLKGNRQGAGDAFDEALRNVDPHSEFSRIIKERRQSLGL